MSAQTPVPKDHPLMVAWQAHKATEQHANDVRWAKVEAHTDGALWSAFEAGWRAREAAITAAGWVVEQGWQPIETAPQDRMVLVYAPSPDPTRWHTSVCDLSPIICAAKWHPEGGWCVCEIREVTHWRPLPAAPQEDRE